MNALKLSSFAAAFLTGTALATLPALSQDAGDTPAQTKQLPKQGTEPSQDSSGSDTSRSQGMKPAQPEGNSETGQSGGQSSQDETSGKKGQPGQSGSTDDGTSGQMQNSGEAEPETETTSRQADQPKDQSSDDEASEKKMKSGGEDSGDNAAPDQTQNSGTTDSGTETAPSQTKQQNDQSTTEQRSGGTKGSVNITEEQTTEIRTVIKEDDVEPADVDFDVNVGISVPGSVELHQLPSRIVKIVPEYEGYVFFVTASGQIVIVEPDTHEIVYIIVA